MSGPGPTSDASLPDDPILADAERIAGPERHGNELQWQLRLASGQLALLARLVDELAEDPSIRRRYRRDVSRLAELDSAQVAAILAWGPHDAEALAAQAPWRLRAVPEGQPLERWLARAPAPPDEVADTLARLCELLAPLHARGFVVRDLSPARIIEGPERELTLVDVGLARTDILSTRTAASLVLEGSPYTAPELMAKTAVDGRADLYAVGVLGFRALTGQHPFGDTHALLRPAGDAPAPSTIHAGVRRDFDALIIALLAIEPDERPASAALVAEVLRGRASLPSHAIARRSCQNCAAQMPVGQRLCLSCGKVAVQFRHLAADASDERYKLVLRKAKEKGEFMTNLRQLCAELCDGEVPTLNFVIGDARMYSKAERERALKLPVTLFNDLDLDGATALAARFAARGVKLEIEKIDATDGARGSTALTRRQKVGLSITTAVGLAFGVGMFVLTEAVVALGVALLVTTFIAALVLYSFRKVNKARFERWGRSLMSLRPTPAALPASDPLVARLAALLQAALSPDVHALVSRLALQVQRVFDHRAHNLGAADEIELALSTLEPLVTQVEARVAAIQALDEGLTELDEGHLVRALAASNARDEPAQARTRYLDGLDRLRDLEVERARALDGLARACDLARRSVDMGLRVQDPEAEHERQIKLALAALQ